MRKERDEIATATKDAEQEKTSERGWGASRSGDVQYHKQRTD
jgi:hypothetical protein